MSIKVLALLLSALALAVAAGFYAALRYYALGDIMLAVGVAAACGVVALVGRATGRTGRRRGRSGGSAAGSGWMWFDGGGGSGDGGGGWGGGDGGGGGGCGSG